MACVEDIYQKTILFAANAHRGQFLPATEISYVVHLSNVAMEVIFAHAKGGGFDLETAIYIALLHDTLEDTDTAFDEIKILAGERAAKAVMALSKDKKIPKENRLADSIDRIIKCGVKEAAAVKLADRITNMQKPPASWDCVKIKKYQDEAREILKKLGYVNDCLAERLRKKIEEYGKYY